MGLGISIGVHHTRRVDDIAVGMVWYRRAWRGRYKSKMGEETWYYLFLRYPPKNRTTGNRIRYHIVPTTFNGQRTLWYCARDGVCKLMYNTIRTYLSLRAHSINNKLSAFCLRSNLDSIEHRISSCGAFLSINGGPITTSSQGDVAIGEGGVNHLCFQPFLN